MQTLFNQYEGLVDKFKVLCDRRKQAKAQHESFFKAYTQGQIEDDLYQEAVEVTKALVELVSKEGMGQLANLLSFGLCSIFPDEIVSTEIKMGDRGGKKTAQVFLRVREKGEIKAVSLSDVGGGIQVVVALVFRIYLILQLKLRRFLLIDEAFTQVSVDYMDTLVSFLQVLSEKFGFEILCVSHDERLISRMPQVFLLKDGSLKKLTDTQR